MFDGHLMSQVHWTIVDTIHLKGNKFVTGVKFKAAVNSELNGNEWQTDSYYLPTVESYQSTVLSLCFDCQFYSRWSGLSSRTVSGKPVKCKMKQSRLKGVQIFKTRHDDINMETIIVQNRSNNESMC